MLSPTSSMKLAAALALLAPTATLAQSCDALKENVLTSSGCPTSCASNPCVLFSPSQKDQCQVTPAAGECKTDDTFVVPGTTTPCNVTYQCLDSLVDSKNKWFLALTPSSSQNSVTTVAVTQVSQLTYPSSGVFTVQVAGGLGRNARGDIKNVKVDDSFFATPASVKSFYLSEMNVQNALSTIDFSARGWSAVAFNNCNLKQVPAGLSKLALQYVELSKNFITNISDAMLFKAVSTLNLAYNDLKDLPIALPAIVTLNLTGNPLNKIPDAIFSMTTLKTLSMRQCNLTNVALTETQLAFVQQLQTFDADLTVTSCPNGTISKTLIGGASSVCVPGVATTAPPAESKKSSSSSTGVIIGVIAGVVVVVVVGIIAFFMCRRKRPSDNSSYTSLNKGGDTSLNGTDFTDGSGSDTFGSSNIWNDPDLLAVRIEYRDIEPIKLLSRGGFGEVWLGLYMNENVAIKRLLSDKKTMTDALAFATEIKIMARLDHPKVVRFIGVAWTNALTIQAVTEFMDCGDLRSLLDSSRASSLTWANLKCQIAIDIADALVYLHTLNPKLIHRDLKSRNVLIDANTGAKLSDFGISRNRSVEETMTAGVGTARWIAPEVILGGHYTEFADIYSFGVVLSELDTAKTPFHDAVNTNGAKMPDVTILQLVSAGKLQPSFEPTCPESIVKLARACLSFDPAQRPSAIHISYELRKIMKDEL